MFKFIYIILFPDNLVGTIVLINIMCIKSQLSSPVFYKEYCRNNKLDQLISCINVPKEISEKPSLNNNFSSWCN